MNGREFPREILKSIPKGTSTDELTNAIKLSLKEGQDLLPDIFGYENVSSSK